MSDQRFPGLEQVAALDQTVQPGDGPATLENTVTCTNHELVHENSFGDDCFGRQSPREVVGAFERAKDRPSHRDLVNGQGKYIGPDECNATWATRNDVVVLP